MGLETLLALAVQGVGTGVGSAIGGIGSLTGASGLAATGAGISSGAAGAATAIGGALGGGASVAGMSTGIGGAGVTGIGVTGAEIATGIGTASTIASAAQSTKPVLQTKSKDIKTGVGEKEAFMGKKKRSVASTVQGGGIKRNSLG